MRIVEVTVGLADGPAEIAGADLVIVPELHHLGLMERPDLFTAPILTFLERVEG